jgi:hypothetical protein
MMKRNLEIPVVATYDQQELAPPLAVCECGPNSNIE